jgi:hypothetical protein
MSKIDARRKGTAKVRRDSVSGRFTIVSRKLASPAVTTVRVGKKDAKVDRRAGSGSVIEQRVYDKDGRLKTVITVDARSATLGNELRYAFEKSVAKARQENKKKFGSADVRLRQR